MYTYLLINLCAVLVPFLASFHPRLRFYRNWGAFAAGLLPAAALFIAWDIQFTGMGVWGFNPRYLLGTYWLGLPVEEWMFFLCIPYCCVFSYHCFRVLIPGIPFQRQARTISAVLAVILLILAGIYVDRWYTAVTFSATALMLLGLSWRTPAWLGRFYFTWLIMLLPFLIVNGILTGSWLDEPVVWYNNAENMGIRIFTIPAEDTMYGMLLVLITVSIYEKVLALRQVPAGAAA